ncbi:MAG: SMP-30/gluconolactonase/LRE family protein [Planctomycetota bacterium]
MPVAEALAIDQSVELRFLPEGPIQTRDDQLSWVAIQHAADQPVGSLNLLNLSDLGNVQHALPGRPGFAFECETPGRFVVGLERELGIFDTDNGSWTKFCDGIDAQVTNTIINDGVVWEDNLVFGCKDIEFATKKAGLYLFRGRDKTLVQLRDDQICSNGKAVWQDAAGTTFLIDIDSPTRQIVQYELDIEAGKLGDATVLVDLTEDPAVPDGGILTPDGKSFVVSMFRFGAAEDGQTRCYDLATGELQEVWTTPGSPQNTCPAWVLKDGKLHLLITTAIEHMDEETLAACPNSGRLFLAETDFSAAVYQAAPKFPW